MGKRLKQQVRGKGTPKYRAPSHRYKAEVKYLPYDDQQRMSMVRGEVIGFIDDPARSTLVAVIQLENGDKVPLLAAEGMSIGDRVEIGAQATIKVGNVLPLYEIPEGMYVFNIEKRPGDGGKIGRSSGSYAQVVVKEGGIVKLKLPSNKVVEVNGESRAQIGIPAGANVKQKPLLKAGTAHYKHKAKNRLWPRQRGVSMSPFDHPFGGKQHHEGRSTTVSRHAPPGQKVGHIRAKQTGRRVRKSGGA